MKNFLFTKKEHKFRVGVRAWERKILSKDSREEKAEKKFFPNKASNKKKKKLNTDTIQLVVCIAAVRALCLPVLVRPSILNFDIQ